MKTPKNKTFYGSITKKESLQLIESNIFENTWVAEANLPYSNYYGQLPNKSKPNSIFLFTKYYYPLEEVLRFSQNMNSCIHYDLNFASAVLKFNEQQYSAIRVKNFPDYSHLQHLQECFTKQGVQWTNKIHFMIEAEAKITKCFELEEVDENIYLDTVEEDKGYIFLNKPINRQNFDSTIKQIKNNSNRFLFDAVPGIFIMGTSTVDVVRIFSKKLKLELLLNMRTELNKVF